MTRGNFPRGSSATTGKYHINKMEIINPLSANITKCSWLDFEYPDLIFLWLLQHVYLLMIFSLETRNL